MSTPPKALKGALEREPRELQSPPAAERLARLLGLGWHPGSAAMKALAGLLAVKGSVSSVYVDLSTYVCMYVSICLSIYIHIYKCMYRCVYIYT